MTQNGHTSDNAFRADLGMRIVLDTPSYAAVGGLMDEINAMLEALFRRDGLAAEFDFTHFNTHPCKTAQMADMVYAGDAPSYESEQPPLRQH